MTFEMTSNESILALLFLCYKIITFAYANVCKLVLKQVSSKRATLSWMTETTQEQLLSHGNSTPVCHPLVLSTHLTTPTLYLVFTVTNITSQNSTFQLHRTMSGIQMWNFTDIYCFIYSRSVQTQQKWLNVSRYTCPTMIRIDSPALTTASYS